MIECVVVVAKLLAFVMRLLRPASMMVSKTVLTKVKPAIEPMVEMLVRMGVAMKVSMMVEID